MESFHFAHAHYRLLRTIPIVSARTTFEDIYKESPLLWKTMSFMYIISEWAKFVSRVDKRGLRVVSIGDSLHEREALYKVHEQHSVRFIPKSIKMFDRPSIQDLMQQHEVLQRDLGQYMESHLGCDLVVRGNHLLPSKVNYAESNKRIAINIKSPISSRSHSMALPRVSRRSSKR